MVRGTVNQKDCVLAKVRSLKLDSFKELLQKQAEDLTVCYLHGQCHIDLTQCVYGSQHTYPRSNWYDSLRVALTTSHPFSVPEVHMIQPRLVNVQDGVALIDQLEHLLCVLLTNHQ